MIDGLIAEFLGGPRRAPLLYAAHRKPLTSDRCLAQVERSLRTLRAQGVVPEDRVAVALPNGPELAMSFIAISSAATVAPLNPQYSAGEFVQLLQDIGARVLVTQSGFCPAAVTAANQLGIPVWELHSRGAEDAAGEFVLEGPAVGPPAPASRSVSSQSIALLLHSSGTTARPKLIPLTHANLVSSAANIARTLALDERDVCLNVMPLFHIHGLVGALLASFAGGAGIFCSSGFDTFRFHRCAKDAGATWCTAVPTMYQAMLARAVRKNPVAGRQFRMLRSSSAHLHSPVWKKLEELFECPVLNSYGMTEASHQIASNPLPPEQRKIGTVGPATGPKVAIAGEDGSFKASGESGEVVIRGDAVTSGYLSPQGANAEAFHDCWLRTGDEGRLDADGYLTLTGRLKEIINVGGEKISPAEVDEVLMQHPAVAQALAFAAPCAATGERICAAVVLQHDSSEAELRRFVRDRLARFKVPEKILFMDAIPKGPTGKLQRRGLAEKLGLGSGTI